MQNALMDALTRHSAELQPMSDETKASEAVVPELELAALLEAIQARASTLTPVMEKILQTRPSSHWGINE